MDKQILTDEVLRETAYSRIDFTAGFYEWNVSLDGKNLYSFEVDSDNFSDMDSEDLQNFVNECIITMQENLRDDGKIGLANGEVTALKGMMFDAWKYHFGIEERSDDVKVVRPSLDSKIQSASNRAAESYPIDKVPVKESASER